jgi:hypothetical protein
MDLPSARERDARDQEEQADERESAKYGRDYHFGLNHHAMTRKHPAKTTGIDARAA